MSGVDIRAVAEYANMRFDCLMRRVGRESAKINTGAVPNDCAGDTIDLALIKTIDNVTEALHEIMDRLGLE